MTIRHKRNTFNIFALVMKSHLEKMRNKFKKQQEICDDRQQDLHEAIAKLKGFEAEVAFLEVVIPK